MLYEDNYGNAIHLTKAQAAIGYHQGACDADIAYLRTLPRIKRQLAKLDPDSIRRELKEYGAWSEEELSDHEANLTRWLWNACGNIMDEHP